LRRIGRIDAAFAQDGLDLNQSILMEDFRIVAIDDGVDLMGHCSQFPFSSAANLFHVYITANAETYEIHEEQALVRVCEPLFDRLAQQLVRAQIRCEAAVTGTLLTFSLDLRSL
jgi:hypothetical protein